MLDLEIGTFFKHWENEIRYTNPMVTLRKEQLAVIEAGITRKAVLQKIFETIPKNFRAIFMYEREFERAQETCRGDFVRKLKECLAYCIEVIG